MKLPQWEGFSMKPHTHTKKKSSHKSEILTSSCPIPWEKIPKSYSGIVIKLFTVFELTTVFYPFEICFNFCGVPPKNEPKKTVPNITQHPKISLVLGLMLRKLPLQLLQHLLGGIDADVILRLQS